ncbi:MAG TPA: hypothetical protein VEG35_03905 [Burkholderiales bacterium]|nr:hypothetical protein [Burkholderiales bacterium]
MFKRALILILAALLFALGLGILGFLNSIPSIKEKRALARMRLEEEALARTFEIWVVRSGFRQKSTGARDIYVPSLLVEAVNLSGSTSKPSTFMATFLRNGRTFCGAGGSIPALKPGDGCELWLKCIELTGLGSVAWGLSLAETTEPMNYEVWLESGRASIIVAKGELKSSLLE